MRSAEEFDAVQRLIANGLNDCAVAHATGVPRRTSGAVFQTDRVPPHDTVMISLGCLRVRTATYLLGLYLGDGFISRHPRAWRLRFTLDEFVGPKA